MLVWTWLPPWAQSVARVGYFLATPVLFVLGVTWDAFTLGRIDYWLDNLIYAAYLLGLGVVLVLDHRAARGRLPALLVRARPITRLGVHFLLGGLLSAYVIYYFQSAATWLATLWLVGIGGLLVANEFFARLIGTAGLRLALYLLCCFSFLLFWIPVATGLMGRGVSLLAGGGALVGTTLVLLLMEWSPRGTVAVVGRAWGGVVEVGERLGQPAPRRIDEAARALVEEARRRWRGFFPVRESAEEEVEAHDEAVDPRLDRLRRDPVARAIWQLAPTVRYGSYAASWGGLLLVLLVLDLAGAIPPVPLSTLSMGVYREVRMSGESATLRYERPPWWRPFDTDDRRFRLRTSDRACVFAPVYAPRRISPRLYHRWEFWSEEDRGWVWTRDQGTWVQATGGRQKGSMHFTCKRNGLRPGLWRVSVETEDARVLGRLRFQMVEGAEEPPELLERAWP